MAAATASVLLRDPFFKCKAATSSSSASASASLSPSSSSSSVPIPLKWNPLSVHRLLGKSNKSSLCLQFQLPNRASELFRPFSELLLPSLTAAEENEQSSSLLGDPLGSALQALRAMKKPALFTAALLGVLLAVASPPEALSDASHRTAANMTEEGSIVASAIYDAGSKFGIRSDPTVETDGLLPRFMVIELAAASLLNGINSARRHRHEPKLQVCSVCTQQSSRVADIKNEFDLYGLKFEKSDNFTSPSNFRCQLVASRIPLSRRRPGVELNDQISKTSYRQKPFKNQCKHIPKAVATIEPARVISSNNVDESDEGFQFSSNLGLEMVQHSNGDFHELDDREKLRRMRISKANKGNVPWNKGRRHSAETIRRIRERTKLAMQDPKVKMKLVNLGHAQTEETRIKIGAGVREGWQRRREKLMVQEGCCFEWQNCIAEAARRGGPGEDELQWDSYKILDEQLKKEWLESVEKRKIMPRPKGNKRAPKSPEQRRKISEAISAKWADPGYRDRVCNALAKYHGLPAVGAERRQRKKLGGETPLKRESVKKKQSIPSSTNLEAKSIKKVISNRKRTSAPLYKDPLASSKLEMIRKIREQRTILEIEKREATERAKKLIAEAEKAAKALEIAALRSPLARASLLETRKLIAEATRSIENIEAGQLTSLDLKINSSDSDEPPNDFLENPETLSGKNEPHVNGIHHLYSSNHKDNDFDTSPLPAPLNHMETLAAVGLQRTFTEVTSSYDPNFNPHNVAEQSETTVNQAGRHFDRFIGLESNTKAFGSLELKQNEASGPSTKIKKKWVCGRLIEVEDQSEEDMERHK